MTFTQGGEIRREETSERGKEEGGAELKGTCHGRDTAHESYVRITGKYHVKGERRGTEGWITECGRREKEREKREREEA